MSAIYKSANYAVRFRYLVHPFLASFRSITPFVTVGKSNFLSEKIIHPR